MCQSVACQHAADEVRSDWREEGQAPLEGRHSTPRDAIVARLEGKSYSWLARELAQRTGRTFAASRSNVHRWISEGVTPSPRYASLLGDILGGTPEDYGLGEGRGRRSVTRGEFEEFAKSLGHNLPAAGHAMSGDAREERLRATVIALDERMRELEAQVAAMMAAGVTPKTSAGGAEFIDRIAKRAATEAAEMVRDSEPSKVDG